MKLSNLFNDDKAVSPVIGVILMVAITVILAAVIGTFVLGLGDSISDTSPSASISSDISDGNIVFTHQSGQSIETDRLRVSSTNNTHIANGGDLDGEKDVDEGEESDLGSSFRAGDQIVVVGEDGDFTDGDDETARLIWESGGQSSTLSSQDYDFEND